MTSHPAGTIDQQSGVIMTSAYEELLWASEDEPVSRRTFLSGALLVGAGLLAG